MKTNRTAKIAALAMTLAFAGSALAQFTAPPKTQEFLNSYNRNHTAVTAPAPAQLMQCGMCKDQVTTQTDYTARGASKPQVTTATHLCKMCDTELKTIGIGKTAKTVPVHNCDHACSVASNN